MTTTLDMLYATLDRRERPEDVAERVKDVLTGAGLDAFEARVLDRACARSLRRMWLSYTSMRQDWAKAVGLDEQVGKARALFESARAIDPFDASAPEAIGAFLDAISPEIGKARGENDFRHDRLDRGERRAAGLVISRRKYDRKWRLLRRMERKLVALVREIEKRRLTRIGKQRLAPYLSREDFVASPSSACFVAYMVARLGLRSEFTVWGQQKAFDELAAMLYARCLRDPHTSFFAIAHVHPTEEVLARLTDEQRGRMLATSFEVMRRGAVFLDEIDADRHFDRARMVVRRGDDSSTWNQVAGALNQARDHWVSLLHAMGAGDVLADLCVPKTMRLIAGDVAAWHECVGHSGDANVAVAAALPPSWEVLLGRASCTRADVERACRAAGVDPTKGGWIAPRERTAVAPLRPTPELVHGVAIGSPLLAKMLRSMGVFSGKPKTWPS
jgi:hypothetical protein